MTCYISLYVGTKRLIFYLSPRDGHVIIISGCLILTAVNLIILIRMGNITDRLVLRCARSIATFDISLHEVCVRVGVRYVITKFSRMDSLPNFVTHGAPLRTCFVRENSAIMTFEIVKCHLGPRSSWLSLPQILHIDLLAYTSLFSMFAGLAIFFILT